MFRLHRLAFAIFRSSQILTVTKSAENLNVKIYVTQPLAQPLLVHVQFHKTRDGIHAFQITAPCVKSLTLL